MELKCEYENCDVVFTGTKGENLQEYGFHIGAKHSAAPATAPAPATAGATAAAVVKSEEKKKTDRQKMKPPVFTENETRDDYERKRQDFKTYSNRAKLSPEEMSEDLYYACETPLKKRLRASGIVDKEEVGKTEFKSLCEEMERICAPKANRHIEREEFKRLVQGEDESITAFESRVRTKAMQCDFNACRQKCNDRCLTTVKCGFNRETDEIITQILAGMRDKDLQKKMWAEDEHHEDLQKVLATIKSHEAADVRQAASNTESGSFVAKMKCHKCGKMGHAQKNCTLCIFFWDI